jgi:hypothetical protein
MSRRRRAVLPRQKNIVRLISASRRSLSELQICLTSGSDNRAEENDKGREGREEVGPA